MLGEGFQAHECDLACNFCAPLPDPCPPPAQLPAPACFNKLDREIEDGTCDTLIAEGSFSCAEDFCTGCEGQIGTGEGQGEGGHQRGACNLACNLCPAPPPPVISNCTEAAEALADEWNPQDWKPQLPDGYLAETPAASEILVDALILILNGQGVLFVMFQVLLDSRQ